MYRILFIALLGICLGVCGCQELRNPATVETMEEETPEVVARFCHIARIGSLAEMPEDVCDGPKTNKDGEQEVETLDFSSVKKLQEAPISQAVANEVGADILAIVESTAAEISTDKGIRASNRKEEELDLAIEMVQEEQAAEAELQEKMAKMKISEEDFDEEKAEETKKEGEKSTTMEILEVAEEEDSEKSEGNTESGEEEGLSFEDAKTVKMSYDERHMTAQMEAELERQAEACLELLKNTPNEVREEIKKANFQNVSYRLVKVPGSLIFGKTAPEYYLIRTMEYTGMNLTKDYQTLILSKNFSSWIQDQERYLDIITLDERHHEFWVEAPEFWNSSEIE